MTDRHADVGPSPPYLQGLIARLLSEQTLTAMGAPGGHMFQPGYALGGRLINFVYKGAIFATIGMMVSTAAGCWVQS